MERFAIAVPFWVLIICGIAGLTACAGRAGFGAGPSVATAVESGQDAVIGRFSGRYHPGPNDPEQGKSRRFIMDVERRRRGEAVIRIRGRVAGTALIALMRSGRVELLFRRERQAVTGPDTPAVWKRWTGLPLSGEIIGAALYPDPDGVVDTQIHGWRVVIEPPARGDDLPARAEALSAEGARLELTKTSERATRASAWPTIPSSFQIIEVDANGEVRKNPGVRGGVGS